MPMTLWPRYSKSARPNPYAGDRTPYRSRSEYSGPLESLFGRGAYSPWACSTAAGYQLLDGHQLRLPRPHIDRKIQPGAHQEGCRVADFAALVAIRLHAQERILNDVFRVLLPPAASPQRLVKPAHGCSCPIHEIPECLLFDPGGVGQSLICVIANSVKRRARDETSASRPPRYPQPLSSESLVRSHPDCTAQPRTARARALGRNPL